MIIMIKKDLLSQINNEKGDEDNQENKADQSPNNSRDDVSWKRSLCNYTRL